MNQSKNKPVISEHEAEELIKGMGRVATVVVHDNGLVTAIAISTNPSDTRIQTEVDGLLYEIQRKYRIVKKETKKSCAPLRPTNLLNTGAFPF